MATWSGSVAYSADDARQGADGSVVLTGGTITVGGTAQRAGFRFRNVTIPKNAIISTAAIRFYLTTTANDSPNSATVDFQNGDNAAVFTTNTNNLSNRTLTGSSVTWPGNNIGTGWDWCTLDPAAVQTIVDRNGWASGNAMVVIVRGSSSSAITIAAYDSYPDTTAELVITYTTEVTEGSVTDGVEGSDTGASGRRASVSVTEGTALGEPDRVRDFIATMAAGDTGGVTDTAARRVDAQAIHLDGATLADIAARGLLLSGVATDSTVLSDSPGFVFRVTRTAAESIATGSTAAGAGTFHVAAVDGSKAHDLLSGSLSSDTITVTATNSAWENAAGDVTISGSSANVNTSQPYLAILFPDVPLPADSTIVEAFLRIYAFTYDDPALAIYAEDGIAPAALTAGTGNTDISERTPTTATVAWADTNIGGGYVDSPDIADVIQEVHDIAGWVGGVSDVLLILEDDASGGWIRMYAANDPIPANRPQLIISYSTSAALVLATVSDGLTASDASAYGFLASLALSESVAASEMLARIMQTGRAAVDGLLNGDANVIGRLTAVEASGGVTALDATSFGGTYPVDAGDTVINSDTAAARMDAIATIAHGAILGETLAKVATYDDALLAGAMTSSLFLHYLTARPVVSETAQAGSGIVATLSVDGAVLDGTALGAALLGLATLHAAAADGALAGDTLLDEVLAYLQANVYDGVKAGDVIAGRAIGLGVLADSILPGEGYTGVLHSLRAFADGLTADDAPAAMMGTTKAIADSVVSSEAPTGTGTRRATLADAMKAGDSVLLGLLSALDLADGLITGDTTGGGATFHIQTADGAAFSAALSKVLQTAMAVADGARASDIVIRFTARGEVTATFVTRLGTVTAVIS